MSPQKRAARYEAHIASAEWRMFRLTILAERGHACERCGDMGSPLHLHHKHYRTFGHERPRDVELLCKPCHMAHHGIEAAKARWAKEKA